jgi:ATP-dependent RNA helicase HelY
MTVKKNYQHIRRRRQVVSRQKRPFPANLSPGADARLKKIFANIGTPEKSEFRPDPFQVKAIDVIRRGLDCLVTAPTGSGKTWIAEQAIRLMLKTHRKAWYASPLKALSNSKYAEFSDLFGRENTGILTGDRKENGEAAVIVGTTEILRNQLYDAMHRGVDLETDFVILDEAHFLGDPDRGVVWEETMIYLPARIPLLLLSATVGNADLLAGWLKSIRGKRCVVVEEFVRPVPLYPLFLHPSGTLYPLLTPQKDASAGKTRLYAKVAKAVAGSKPPQLGTGHSLPPMIGILEVLRKYRLLPAIFFLKSRSDCDGAVAMCAGMTINDDPERARRRMDRIDEFMARFPHVAGHRQMKLLSRLAIGAHHSGQLPAWKLMIETLMTEGLLDAVFATSTVAAGVNFPARTILFLNSDRFNGREFVPLTATEFHQMTGRAGRRGMDNIGFAVVIPGKFMDIPMAARLFQETASDVHSQIRIDFSMTLNLLLSHKPEQILNLLDHSFAAYLMAAYGKKRGFDPDVAADPRRLWHDFLRHLDFLKAKGYVDETNHLTEDGMWASQLRIDHPLMVAEGFRCGLFPASDPALLAAVMAAFVNEKETDDSSVDRSKVSKNLIKSFNKIDSGLAPFAAEMRKQGFSAPALFFLPAWSLYLWARGVEWAQAVKASQMAEGDLAMLILRTADNLRHIRNIGRVFPEAAKTSEEAIERILRDPVISTHDVADVIPDGSD